MHQQLAKKEAHISSNYTCHCWLLDGKFLIGTDQGDILLCEGGGDVKMELKGPEDNFYIQTIKSYSKGFVTAGDKGQIMIFEKVDDPKSQYSLIQSLPPQVTEKTDKKQLKILPQLIGCKVKAVDISASEDTILFTTDSK